MNNLTQVSETVKYLISIGKTEKVFSILKEEYKNQKYILNKVLLLESQYKKIREESTLHLKDTSYDLNRLNLALLNFCDENKFTLHSKIKKPRYINFIFFSILIIILTFFVFFYCTSLSFSKQDVFSGKDSTQVSVEAKDSIQDLAGNNDNLHKISEISKSKIIKKVSNNKYSWICISSSTILEYGYIHANLKIEIDSIKFNIANEKYGILDFFMSLKCIKGNNIKNNNTCCDYTKSIYISFFNTEDNESIKQITNFIESDYIIENEKLTERINLLVPLNLNSIEVIIGYQGNGFDLSKSQTSLNILKKLNN